MDTSTILDVSSKKSRGSAFSFLLVPLEFDINDIVESDIVNVGRISCGVGSLLILVDAEVAVTAVPLRIVSVVADAVVWSKLSDFVTGFEVFVKVGGYIVDDSFSRFDVLHSDVAVTL